MHEIDPSIRDGIVIYDEDRRIVVTAKNGLYCVLYDNKLIYKDLDINDAEVYGQPDVIIDKTGVIFTDNTNYPYMSRLSIIFPNPPLRLYKATDNTNPRQVPGFMAYDKEDVKQYLTGGRRHGEYGGAHLIFADITQVESLGESTSLMTANYGSILLISDTPCIIDFGDNDGVLVLQEVEITVT